MTRKYITLFIGLYIMCIINVSAMDTSQASVVMEHKTGRILYANNANEKKLIASTTKIMTAILTIENTNIKEKIKVGKEVLAMYGTNIYIEVGETITIEDLLYGLLLRSGNDAAIVLAYYVGGTEEKFVQMMNEKASELGMTNTHFNNSHGLDDYNENYSTAYDMALLSVYASKNKVYKKISSTKKYSTQTDRKSYLWYNRNKLLNTYELCTGGKNGYTPKAGRTLVTTAKKDNIELTVVTLNDPDEYDTHIYLYNKIYSSYQLYKIIDKETFKIPESLYQGKYELKSSFIYPVSKDEISHITTEIVILNKKIDRTIGYVNIKLNDKTIGIVDIYKDEQKKEDISIFKQIINYVLDILKKLILGRQKSLNPGPLVPIPLEIYTLVLSRL